MAVPSEAYDPLLVVEIDSRSPITPGVMAKIRESIIHLYEVLYGDAFVAIIAHDHDGINSASVSNTTAIPMLTEHENENEKTMSSATFATQYKGSMWLSVAKTVTFVATYFVRSNVGGGDGVIAQTLINGSDAGAISPPRTSGGYAWVDGAATFDVILGTGRHDIEVQIKRDNTGAGNESVRIAGCLVASL